MKKLAYFALDYYDRRVIRQIIEKYGMEPMEATRRFLISRTHELLEDAGRKRGFRSPERRLSARPFRSGIRTP